MLYTALSNPYNRNRLQTNDRGLPCYIRLCQTRTTGIAYKRMIVLMTMMKSGWNRVVSSSLLNVLLRPVEKLDGTWAWIICFVNFGLLFCVVGVWLTFGVIYVGLLEHFSNHTNVDQPANASGNVTETVNVGLGGTLGM